MQEQINERSVALYIKGAKLTGRVLAKAMRAFLQKARGQGKSGQDKQLKHGKQSVRSLTKQGASLASVEDIADINSFKRVARKYNVDFAVKRDDSATPSNWIVFFKAKDDKSLSAALNEYTKRTLSYKPQKTPMLARLQKFKALAKSVAAPVKNRDRGGHEL